MSTRSRLHALDGLRGVAALVVVIHHSLLVSPVMASAYYGDPQAFTPLQWLLVYTPLHLVWGGTEAVVLFFVLSGFVLVRSTRAPAFDWFSYTPARMVRLYVPVVAAVLAGAAVISLLPRGGGDSPWLAGHPDGYPLHDMLQDITLLGGTSGAVSPLWSLRWEVIFSLLLPLALYLVRLIPAWLLGVVSIAVSTWGAAGGESAARYLAVFGVGVALAGEWDRIGAWARRHGSLRVQAVWAGCLAAGLALMSAYWPATLVVDRDVARAVTQPAVLVGACLVIVAAMHCRPLQTLLSWRPVVWLGAISFSLYLVHEPLVRLMAAVTGSARFTVLTAVPVALAAAIVFWMLVEHPAHLLSRRVRRHARAAAGGTAPQPAVRGGQDTRPLQTV